MDVTDASVGCASTGLGNSLASSNVESAPCDPPVRDIRIWMDGAFDMLHFGHMNAFRLGKALGTTLVVGVNNDESITACKGKPVTSEEERIETVRGCKWVDEVVTDVPYIMNEEYLEDMMVKHRIDFIVHGDDPCMVDGKDVYEAAQKLGKYLTIPRTEGISTTHIVGRILSHIRSTAGSSVTPTATATDSPGSPSKASGGGGPLATYLHGKSNFLTTVRMMRLFSASVKDPPAGARVVYIGGTWDLLHAGDLSVLEQARALGDYLVVGVYGDALASVLHSREARRRGQGAAGHVSGSDSTADCDTSIDHTYPILSMQERVLSILGCKFVGDVLIDAPYVLTSDLLSSLNISTVATDSSSSNSHSENGGQPGGDSWEEEGDALRVPREGGMLRAVQPLFPVTAGDIMDRIQQQEEKFKKKFAAKKALEDEYYALRYDKAS